MKSYDIFNPASFRTFSAMPVQGAGLNGIGVIYTDNPDPGNANVADFSRARSFMGKIRANWRGTVNSIFNDEFGKRPNLNGLSKIRPNWRGDTDAIFNDEFANRPGLNGLGDVGTDETAGADTSNWLKDVPGWIKDIQLAINTQKLLDLNIQRAQMGLPPISSQSVAPTINLGMSPEVQKMVLIGAVGLGAVLLLSRRKAKG